VDRLDRDSRQYVQKTTVMASDGIACRILIQNEQLEQVDMFPYLETRGKVNQNDRGQR